MNSCRPYKNKDMRRTVNNNKFYAPSPFSWRLMEAGNWLDVASATAPHIEGGKCYRMCYDRYLLQKKIRSQHYCIDPHKFDSTELARNVGTLELGFTPGLLHDTKPCKIINVLGQSSRHSDPLSTQPVQYHSGANCQLYNRLLSPRYRRCASRSC